MPGMGDLAPDPRGVCALPRRGAAIPDAVAVTESSFSQAASKRNVVAQNLIFVALAASRVRALAVLLGLVAQVLNFTGAAAANHPSRPRSSSRTSCPIPSTVELEARLFLPEAPILTIPSVVITPSSAGIRFEREIYYAEELARAGVAAFVIDSFARGAFRTLAWISKL